MTSAKKDSLFRLKLVTAFAAVYLVWGSTYLAIKIAAQTLPPLMMGGVRFLIAGAILYFWKKFTGSGQVKPGHWRSASIVGALLLLGGNGAVIIGVQMIPSGITALLVATCPIWMIVFDRFRSKGERYGIKTYCGIALGMVGLMILLNPFEASSTQDLNPVGAIIILLGAISWAAGSIYSNRAKWPKSRSLAASMQMICGGALLTVAGVLAGEPGRIHLEGVSSESIIAFFYLVFFGSILAFTAFNWLLNATTPVRVGTYAYVNPLVALFLGTVFAGEALTLQSILAAAVILTGVVLITLKKPSRKSIEKEVFPKEIS